MPAMTADPVKLMETAERFIPFTLGATPLMRVFGPLYPNFVSLMSVGRRICWKLTIAFWPSAVIRW